MSDYARYYDSIKPPRRRCENCASGQAFDKELSPTVRLKYDDIFVCALDGKNKDYRVTCEHWTKRR